MTTRNNTELDAVVSFAIANEAYTREAIITAIRSSLSPELNTALDCCLDEGTLDTGLQFFIDNPHYYPEAQLLNNVHNHHVLQRKAMMAYAYDLSIGINKFPTYTYPSELMYNNTDSNTKRLFFFRSNNH